MLIPYTATLRATPGQIASQEPSYMYVRPSQLSMPPQLGAGGGIPTPRKLRLASARILPATDTLKATIMTGITLGRTCRQSMCGVEEPMALAASK